MRVAIWRMAMGTAAALLSVAGASAQVPAPMTYNQARAYQHFLNSPYSYRAYYGSSPGYVTGGYTPYGYEETAVGPVWWDQRLTPRGFESYHTPAAWSRTVIPYPAPPVPVAVGPTTRTLRGGAVLPERINHPPAPLEPELKSPGYRIP